MTMPFTPCDDPDAGSCSDVSVGKAPMSAMLSCDARSGLVDIVLLLAENP